METTESLNELLDYKMPAELERAFYNELCDGAGVVLTGSLDGEDTAVSMRYIRAAEVLIQRQLVIIIKDSPEYLLSDTGKERAKLFKVGETQNKFIQEVVDLRKKYLMSMSKVERALLRRRSE